MSVLHDLYNGETDRWIIMLPQDEDSARARRKLAEKEQKFTEFLEALPNAEEAVKMYEDIMSAHLTVGSNEDYEYFIKGWKMCAKLMPESVS